MPFVFTADNHGYAFALFFVVIVSPANIKLLGLKIHHYHLRLAHSNQTVGNLCYYTAFHSG